MSKLNIFLNDLKYNCNGLSLIEVMVSTVILAIGFIGIYSFAALSEKSYSQSLHRQQMQVIANQMLDVLEGDINNLNNYDMDLTSCSASSGTDNWNVRGYEWCQRLNNKVGNPSASDTREITISDDSKGNKIVHILLTSQNGGVTLIMKRMFRVND